MRLFLISVLGPVMVGLVAVDPASASCVAPTISFSPHYVDRGGQVTVRGDAWGSDCYDTGPPPEGQGDLGEPLRGIDIVFTQGDGQWLLGTVDADRDYAFTATIVIPVDAEPGDAGLIARRPETYPFVTDPDPVLHISTMPPVQTRPTTDPGAAGATTAVSVAPSDLPTTDNESSAGVIGSGDSDVQTARGFAGGWTLVVILAGAVVAVAGVWLSRSRRLCDRSHRQ